MSQDIPRGALVQIGEYLEGEIFDAEQQVRSSSQASFANFYELRREIIGLFAECYRSKSGVVGTATIQTNKQLSLFAAFAQGMGISEWCISTGQYLKAAAVIKQDYEILTRIKEIRQGKAKERKPPNPKLYQRI